MLYRLDVLYRGQGRERATDIAWWDFVAGDLVEHHERRQALHTVSTLASGSFDIDGSRPGNQLQTSRWPFSFVKCLPVPWGGFIGMAVMLEQSEYSLSALSIRALHPQNVARRITQSEISQLGAS
jgi:hypothetical protein